MKTLVLNSSPRHGGNCDLLCDEWIKGARDKGHEVEKVMLEDMNISTCKACYACRTTKCCFQNDGINELMEKMIEADVIVMATPIYFYSLSGQMKCLIDRCLPRYREMVDKQFVFIVTAADPNHSGCAEAINSMRGFLRCLPGAKVKDILYGSGAWDKGDVLKLPVLKEAYQSGYSL